MTGEQSIATLPEQALPKRAKNALLRGGITTLQDAAEWTDRDLLSPHMGRIYVASLRALTHNELNSRRLSDHSDLKPCYVLPDLEPKFENS